MQENLDGKDFGLERYDPDRNVCMLVAAGERAQLLHDFLAAVGDYQRRGGRATADRKSLVTALGAFADNFKLPE